MLRFGSVPYLNARPLLEGLEAVVGEIHLEVPGVLARRLAVGELDVALAPVVVSFDHPELVLVPAGAVVAHGPVKSVLLFTRKPIDEIRTVGLDTSSRTSAALVRVLFAHRWGTRPTFTPRAPNPDLRRLETDAALLIGDPALQAVWDGDPPIDLGAAWWDWIGLPFVFAGWFARSEAIAAEALAPLEAAADRGRAALDAIAAEFAGPLEADAADLRHYLREHLSFHFGYDEQRGLDRFRELYGQLPPG